ncbi:MAG TPA: lytic transglycosylase domain-containing protein [Thermoanaerobaculaceae bacterium]|nr:lytic transglycosylase domain-containing protein [Thermoanaerobaculaceae bacterium]HRS15528.1 lytic transglycosylase domain-containing protein [Thermoanaerobaculaceae bacterium]
MPAPAAALPPVALAAAARAGQWAEVRAGIAALPKPLTPAVAVLAARAARTQGRPAEAARLVAAHLPRAGELGPALRLEGAEAALALGRDPRPLLEPLLARSAPAAHRREATELLRRSFASLPPGVLRQMARGVLPVSLRAELRAELAVRTADAALALRVVRSGDSRRAAVAAARMLAARSLPEADRLLVASTLLSGGAWREARSLLDGLDPPSQAEARATWLFLRGRAAYRLGDFAVAAALHEQALAAAAGTARHAPAVQRARIAEMAGDHTGALAFWDAARAANPGEGEGWDGALRVRAALGRGEEAVRLCLTAPPAVQREVGPRLVATLLARGAVAPARELLARAPHHLPRVRVLTIELLRAEGQREAAAAALAALVADPRLDGWADVAAMWLEPGSLSDQWPTPSRRPAELGRLAVESGAAAARAALALALAGDPSWAPLLAGAVAEPGSWSGPAAELAALGLEATAARLYPHRFPAGTPAELAWSARTLAAWGNGPAALAAGERLWARLEVPAWLVPDSLRPLVLPPELVGGCEAAATARGLPASWLVAVVRQESRFDVGARSPAGAVGLVQLMPETMQRLRIDPAAASEADPALAAAAGELARLRTAFGGRLGPAAAAYNAGDPVVAAWLGILGDPASPALFAAAVPYRETATYVLRVLEGEALASHLR